MITRGVAGAGGEGRWAFVTRPGPWFWILVGLGLVVRLYLAIATAGTPDVTIWTRHARAVTQDGLIAHYALDPEFNHPPVIGWAMSRLRQVAQRVDITFPSVYRSLVALVDLASAFLIVRVLRGSRWRYLAAGAYCVAPVALVLGAQHGNTDAVLAAGLLGATLLAAGGRPVATGVLIGLLASIKIPGLFAAPALGFAFPRWRDRVVCALVALAVAAPPYLWAVSEASRFARLNRGLDLGGGNFVVQRIFMYRGYLMKVRGEKKIKGDGMRERTPPVWIWGLKNFAARALGSRDRTWPGWARWWLGNSHAVALPLMLLFGFLRRRERSAPAIAMTIAGTYAIFYALVETWATQYFAWSMPFWMLAGLPFAVASNLIAGGYIYCYYAFQSREWLLRAAWAGSVTAADWTVSLTILRDLAVLVFLVFGAYWFARALRDELRLWRFARSISSLNVDPGTRDPR